jgi:hypothetical protein
MILVGDNNAVKRRTRDLGYDSARLMARMAMNGGLCVIH